jgi:N-acyl-D-aspartate/D-glutamate deacylase
MYPCPRPFWGDLALEATALFESARQQGVEISFDVTPWTRGGGPYLQSLPSWAQEGGFAAAVKPRLEDRATRREIAQQLEHGAPGWDEWVPMEWDDYIIAQTGRPDHNDWAGRTIAELAEERDMPPAEASLVLLLEDDGQFWIAPTIKSQDDLNHILSHPLGVPITDGMALAPYGPLHRPTMPRSYGTFPRVLGRYARDWGVISMEEAVKKLTSMGAQRAGIVDRGVLRPGLYADVTIFDPHTVIDRETYQDPHAFPAGIEYVIVNGQVVVDQGKQPDARPGVVL